MIDFFQLREKAVSQAQQKMMGMALAYKRGEMDDASPEVKKMADSMSMKDLEDFAKTKHKGLPVKKESVEIYESVNIKNVDKLKAAARDFGKNRDINSKSIEDALMTIVQSMRVLDKSTSGRADVKHEKIIDKEIVRINNIINKTNYGKTGQSEEGKEIVKILNKHKLNGLSVKKEEVEQIDEAKTSIRVDIPYYDDEPARAKKVASKHRVKVVDKGRDYQITGDKKNIIKFLMDKDALEWDKDEIEEEFPELFEEVEQVDEATIKLDTKKLRSGDKVKTSKGTVEIIDRPVKRSGEDKFKMILHAKDGKKYDLGSHPGPSASAVQSIANNSKLTRPMTEATKVPAGMKFIASYVYKGGDGKDHTHTHLRKGTKMTDPVVVHIDGKEWKTFQSFTKAKQSAIDHIKGMKGPSKFRKEEQDPLLADENPVTENGQDFFELREKLSEQILAHGGKGQYKAVKKGGVVHIMYKGKKVGTADYDSGADAFFASIKGVKGQKDFDTAQDMVDYFAKNKITEELLHEKKDSYPLYHKTYSDAMAAAYAYAKKQGYEVDMDDVDRKVASGPRKPSNGKTNSFTLKLKGEKRKMLAVQVTNLDNKRYELNTYIT